MAPGSSSPSTLIKLMRYVLFLPKTFLIYMIILRSSFPLLFSLLSSRILDILISVPLFSLLSSSLPFSLSLLPSLHSPLFFTSTSSLMTSSPFFISCLHSGLQDLSTTFHSIKSITSHDNSSYSILHTELLLAA